MLKKLFLGLAICMSPILAKGQTNYTVPGTSAPWRTSGTLNTSYTVPGINTGTNPVSVPVTAGNRYQVTYVSGLAGVGSPYPTTDANGQPSTNCNSSGLSGQYVVGSIPCGSLEGAWADATGQLVVAPIFVGNNSGVITAPTGATQLLLGMVDGTQWGDNLGSWVVSVTTIADNKALLTGDIQYHNGIPFNGTLKISLGKASVLDTCSNPMQVVRNAEVSIPVVNGIVQGAANYFIDSNCIGNLPYYVQIYNDKNSNVQNVNWYVMSNSAGNLDVGNMVLSNFGGPIVVAVPLPIVSNPPGAQTVTQPNNTFLSVNNLAVTNQLSYTGTIAGSISGNAATATQLQNSPTQCSSNYFATGIAQNGNANCSNSWPSAASTFNTMTLTGGAGSYTSAAGYLNYNMNNNGRLDSISNPGTNPGGWDWYKSSNTTTPVASMDINGNFTAPSFIGSLIGNAQSASSFATTPTQCPVGQVLTGIQANGNANCVSSSAGSRVCNSAGCYIVRQDGTIVEWGQYKGDLNGGTAGISFPYAFPSVCSTVMVSTSGITDRITYVSTGGASAAPCSTTGFTVGNNGSQAGATWFAIGW